MKRALKYCGGRIGRRYYFQVWEENREKIEIIKIEELGMQSPIWDAEL